MLGENNGGVLLKVSVINTLMFADDIVLLSTSAEGLRRHLSSLESLCKELKMEVNTAKIKISVIGRNTKFNKEPYAFYWKGATLERVEAYKYLGVWITADGSYGRAKQHILQTKAKKQYIPSRLQSENYNIHLF